MTYRFRRLGQHPSVISGCAHHFMQRPYARGAFQAHSARQAYVERISELRAELALEIYAFCVMPNHAHLIVHPGRDTNRVRCLIERMDPYAARSAHSTVRPTRSSIKCVPVDSDEYLLNCARYFELNPVRAGIVEYPEHYWWSSYRERIGLTQHSWLDESESFRALGGTAHERQSRYRKFVGCPIT
jgi:putative transposase